MKNKKWRRYVDPFGVFEIRLQLEHNDPNSVCCEQGFRFNNFSAACRYVFMMNNYEGKIRYPNSWFKYYVVYNPPTDKFINYIRNSIFAPNRQLRREERNSYEG